MNNDLNQQSHDHFFRSIMSNARVAKDFFARHLPSSIKDIVNLDELSFCKDSYIDEELKLAEVDVLYQANFANEPGYLYLLSEHQSSVDKLMPFRLLKYMIKIMDNHIKGKKNTKLPIIYPIVFYHGKISYYGTTDLFDLFGEEHKELAKLVFLQPFNLIYVTKIADDELKKSIWSGTMEFIFKHIFVRDILPYLEQIKEQLKFIEKQAVNSDLLLVILKYVIMQGEAKQKEKIVNFIKQTFTEEIGKKMTTIAGQYYQEGKEEGLQEGVEKGRKETNRNNALKMLTKGISIEVISEVTGLSVEEIKKLNYPL